MDIDAIHTLQESRPERFIRIEVLDPPRGDVGVRFPFAFLPFFGPVPPGLLNAARWPRVCHHQQVTDSLAGKLLVSSLRITEPTFFRTVVLMCAHDDEGALGIVINRPMEGEAVASHLPAYGPFVREPGCLFSGGPVETTAALALARWKEPLDIPAPKFVVGRAGLLDLSKPVTEIEAGLAEVRVFAGYAGWSGGQLESELEEESWFVLEARVEDLFTREPGTLWRDVLRRQQGKLAMFAYAPKDPGVN